MINHVWRSALILAAAGVIAVVAVSGGRRGDAVQARVAGDYYSAHLSRAEAGELVASAAKLADAARSSDAITPRGSATIGPPPNQPSASFQGVDVNSNTADASDQACTKAATTTSFAGQCDDFLLTVNTPQPYGSGEVNVNLTFTSAEDYDVHIFDNANNEVASSTGSNGEQESTTIFCPSLARSPYKIRIVYFQTLMDTQTYTTTSTFNATGDCPPPPVPSYVDSALTFAPGTVVSAHFLGVEPQTTMEHIAPWTPQGNPGGIDNNRIFVDWPLSSRSNIGQLSRSLDGGDSFRLLVDQACAPRSRPNCATGGGGDTESDVNLTNGTVFFSDQEVLANEAYAASTNHGDSFALQTPVSNTTTATDRQWVAATDDSQKIGGAGPNIEAFFMYHVPPSAYIQAVPDTDHLPVPQPAPQLVNVAQSGQPKVDNNPNSPGHGWIYYPFNGYVLGSGVHVATAPSSGYADPRSWTVHLASAAAATSFPWISIDSAGNAYATWDAGGDTFYAFSLISDPRNNPQASPTAGVPGTIWSPPIRINPPGVTSTVFPEGISGGDPGRLGVTYMGTTEHDGEPDGAGTNVHWNVYAAVITGATSSSPVVQTGIVSHRFVHHGNICSSGTLCGIAPVGDPDRDDRSLADMIDVGFDSTGRLGVVYQDNNTASFQDKPRGTDSDPEDFSPFVYFAKEVTGPTLYATTSPVNVAIPRDARDDPAGDATFPNTAAGTNIAALDIRRSSVSLVGSNLVARLKLADASASAMTAALSAYNAGALTQPAERLQYILRFNTGTEAYHMSYEVPLTGAPRAFGGKLNTNPTTPGTDPGDDGIVNPGAPTSLIASGYHTDPGFTVTATVTPGANGEIVLTAPASQFGVNAGNSLFSVTGFATAGPLEQVEQAQTGVVQNAAYVMRTVDAAPPFDTTLGVPTAATLRSFAARRSHGAVVLRWRMATEVGTVGYNVYRTQGARRVKLNKRLVPAAGGLRGHAYVWRDRGPGQSPRYTLEEMRRDGSSILHGPIAARRS